MGKALALGALASFFFAVTFVLNRQMQVAGGHWLWTSSLRFVFMLPMLLVPLLPRGRYRATLSAIRARPASWLLWSTVGFGFFYAFLCAAASYGPSWMVASTWQITIVAGILLTPFIHRDSSSRRAGIPPKQLVVSLVVFAGVALAQFGSAGAGGFSFGAGSAMSLACIVVAAFSYPLGNRAMMRVVPAGMGTTDRVFGMTLCSMPFWVLLMAVALALGVKPTASQALQSFVVALSSGVVATMLFFKATELVKSDAKRLAAIESTQAGEVVFSLLMGVALFGDTPPSAVAACGVAVIVVGIALNGALSK